MDKEKVSKYALLIWDILIMSLLAAMVLIHLGYINNPYSDEDIRLFAEVGALMSGYLAFHKAFDSE